LTVDLLHNLYLGFSVAFIPINLFFCFLGVLLGTLVGVLPGIGPAATIALLLPITFSMRPETALIMIAGIYYGAQYGGSTTSILVNIPGEASSVVTCLDGYQMARQGRAGAALGISAFGSFIGGTLSVIGLMLLGPWLAGFALNFGPPEYFALMFLGIVILTFLSKGSMNKSFISAVLGLFIGTIGVDTIYGVQRYTYGTLTLMDGVGLVPAAMGLFGIAEVLTNLEEEECRDIFKSKIRGLLPTLKDWKESIGPISRGSVLGFFLGILPGGGAILASFTSYATEKRLSRHPETFGQGAIAGVAGPETANNAATGGAMIPLLSLGIPSNVIMALLIGAMMIHGIKPSSFLVNEHPQVFWGIIASMYAGNVMLLVLNLPLIPLWVKLLKVPYGILFPLILLFCLIGVYTVNNNAYEVLIMLIFGALGYLMRKTGFEPAPLLFAMVIGPIMETALRQSLLRSRGSFAIFFTRPISAVLLGAGILLLLLPLLPGMGKKRATIVKEGQED
jgi:putative tricarboxylic transport membrane protein